MPDENPYRYEGTAESLAPRLLSSSQSERPQNLYKAGILAVLVAAVIAASTAAFVDFKAIVLALIITLFVLVPIGFYCWKYIATRDQKTAQYAFWLAAIPLQCFFVWIMMVPEEDDFGLLSLIGFMATISYCFQLIAASVTLMIVMEWK